MPFALFKLLT